MTKSLLTAIVVLVSLASSGDATGTVVQVTPWPDGSPKTEAHRQGGVLHGPYRTWYEDGQRHQERHYRGGREDGHQRAWTPEGTLYVNYVVRAGRRYGHVNAEACLPVAEVRP